jgi:hypothetical protein
MSRARGYVALAAWLLAACDDGVLRAFEIRTPSLGGAGGLGPDAQAGGGRGGTTIDPVAGASATGPISPLIIDDFEDGDPRAKEPLGWWYPINDRTGTQGFGVEPVSRGTTSVYALRTHGSGFRDWGAAVGVNLTAGSALNLSSYEELCFVARGEAATSTQLSVHFVRPVETHYVREVSLSESWTQYCLPLAEFIGPDQAPLVPTELLALQFFFAAGSPFALWLDDVGAHF